MFGTFFTGNSMRPSGNFANRLASFPCTGSVLSNGQYQTDDHENLYACKTASSVFITKGP